MSTFSEETLARLRSLADRRKYQDNEILFLEGDRSDHVVLVDSGVVKVTSVDIDGSTSLLALRGAGELIGDYGCIDGSTRGGTVTCVSPVVAWRIPGKRFTSTLRSDAELCYAVLRETVARARESDGKVGELSVLSAHARVARELARLATQHGHRIGDGGFVLRLKQNDLASAAGVARETVSRALGELRRIGVVHTGRGRVTVLDLAVLIRQGGGAWAPRGRSPRT
jgi:CRP/FNR family cyclic AMP-dependent transcriptional regulator